MANIKTWDRHPRPAGASGDVEHRSPNLTNQARGRVGHAKESQNYSWQDPSPCVGP